ncbi:hypothetical protein Cfor_09997 [Coptotermes formosanus]|uniref:Uncharacterized protein n=1 Tax=Coptotermes formosanus TaxID=36987 RepID=A0A6L2PRY5_COPFO|nr:hypothetical protein Cfor_09997 [Coptotermes formosanus]
MLQVSVWIPVVFVIACLFLVIILCYARPLEVSMGVIITLSGVPAFWLGVIWKNKPLWFQNMLSHVQVTAVSAFYMIPGNCRGVYGYLHKSDIQILWPFAEFYQINVITVEPGQKL